MVFFLMIRRPPSSTRTDTRFPYTTLFRSEKPSMTKNFDFYFDFPSPYGYLASTQIEALAAEFGRQVNWHPILLGPLFKTMGRSEEHTSELQSLMRISYDVFCLNKKNIIEERCTLHDAINNKQNKIQS